MSLAVIARTSGMSILELATQVCTPRNSRNLEALARVTQLHAIEREMLLGWLKRDALIRLSELTAEVAAASGDEVRACEVMRKACVDILRFGNGSTRNESGSHGQDGPGPRRKCREPLTPASESEVLEALERWGREIEEQEEEVYPQIEDSPGRITQIAQMGLGESKSENGVGTDIDRRESSVELAGTASNRTDDYGRKAGLRCQWHPTSGSVVPPLPEFPPPPELPPPRKPLHQPRPPPPGKKRNGFVCSNRPMLRHTRTGNMPVPPDWRIAF